MGGAAVLVVKVVGVLPDVEGTEGLEAAADRVAGTGFLGNDEGTVGIGGEPDPAGAEQADAGGDKGRFEGIKASPLGINPGEKGRFLRRFAPRNDRNRIRRSGPELREIQVVVQDLAGVIEDGAIGLADDFLQGHLFEGRTGNEFVQIVHVPLQVLSVVEGQGLGTDHRRQRIKGIRKGDKGMHRMVMVLDFLTSFELTINTSSRLSCSRFPHSFG